MSEQPYGDLPPHNHTDTSIEAAASISNGASTLRARVMAFVARQGIFGATDEELQERLNMGANTERPRRRELVMMRLVCDSKMRRKTKSGRNAIVWVEAKGQLELI